MTSSEPQKTELFPFPITPYLQRRLNTLSKQANVDGSKVVRWTDLILAGLTKLSPNDLVLLRREREVYLSEKQRGEIVHG